MAAPYAKENFPRRVVCALREYGRDVLTTGDAGEVQRRLTTLDWTAAQTDVRPFLEHEHELQMVTPDALAQLLRGKE